MSVDEALWLLEDVLKEAELENWKQERLEYFSSLPIFRGCEKLPEPPEPPEFLETDKF